MKKLLPLLMIFNLFSQMVICQEINEDFERIKLDTDAKHLFVGIDISPDGKYLAISGNKSYPLYIYDWSERKIVKTIDVGDWVAGSEVKYSTNGKYLLVQQLKMIDWTPNKDKEVMFEIIDVESGKRVLKLDPYHAVTITPDEKYALALTGEEVSFWNIETGKKEKSFTIDRATNGLAVSPDGSMIAVSHKVTEEALAEVPRYKKDKKARKAAAKYKQQVSVYNSSDFSKKFTVSELYDIVYRLSYSDDGKTIYCLQLPHTHQQMGNNERLTFIATIDGITGEAYRKGYSSNAMFEPDYKISHDGKWFGLVSQGYRFLELHIYDSETAKIQHRFIQSWRLMEKNEGDYIIANSRTSFVFLPDNKNIVMTMGNRLILWDMESKE